MFARNLVDCASSKKRKKNSPKKASPPKKAIENLCTKEEISGNSYCVLPGSPCIIRATRWGSYMLQPYYPSLDFSVGREPEKCSSNRKTVIQAREELQSIIDFLHASGKIEKRYAVNIFGSCFVHNWWDGYGDIDFSITPLEKEESSNGEFVNIDIAKREEKVLLLKIAETIKLLSPSTRGNVIPILGARVPILKHTKKFDHSAPYSKKVTWPQNMTAKCVHSSVPVAGENQDAVRAGKLLRKGGEQSAALSSTFKERHTMDIYLRSFSIMFNSCDLPEKDIDAARIEIQEAVHKEIDQGMENYKLNREGSGIDDFLARNSAFFLWDLSQNTLHVTIHNAFCNNASVGFNGTFLKCFLCLRDKKRIGRASVRFVRHDASEVRKEVLLNIEAQMNHYHSTYLAEANDVNKESLNSKFPDVNYRFVPLSLFSIDFDLSLRLLGLRNSKLLQKYFNPNKEVRLNEKANKLGATIIKVGALFLKSWSKKAGINNSSGGMLCTYAFNIMWLHFLLYKSYREGTDGERCQLVNHIDPNEITKDECITKRLELQEYLYTESQNTTDQLLKDDSLYISREYLCNCHTLGSLMMEFFRYFGETFDWNNSVITINRTSETSKTLLGWESQTEAKEPASRDSNTPLPMRQKYLVAIEDPYEKGFNLGRHINHSTIAILKTQFLKEWMRMNNETPQDLIFKRIASMSLQGKPSNSPNVATSTDKLANSDTARLLRMEKMLNTLRESYYTSSSCNDIYSRIPPPDGYFEIVTVRAPEETVRELVTIISQRADKDKVIKHLVRLFAASSIEFSMKYTPGKATLTDSVGELPEIDYIPVEAAVIKALHSSIKAGVFDHKTFEKKFSYLPYLKTGAMKLCSPCSNPTQNKFYSPKPFHATVRSYCTFMNKHIAPLRTLRMPRLKCI
ncbi:hypothetical protein XU18_0529 [Perkinsela sp. CCAP 1560/4]|nr:hypothetical protein XU18_0529 [Perkinsela sp. CCAP 1560/4]|eukprot:KNH09251.1 hypothetical protein XU18_0529 [Perkinsela sp. CCAP 1560/4]